MKNFLTTLLILVIVSTIVLGCLFAYKYFTNKNTELPELNEETTINDPLFSSKNYPRVDASTVTQPLANAFIKNFTGEDIDIASLSYTQTHPAYEKLINGEADLILVTEPSEDELNLAKEKGVALEIIPVVKEGFVFYVNEKNPINSLTIEQIQQIYSGKITNWLQVGGNDEEIKPFQRNVNSGSQTGMLSLVMKGKKMMEPLKENIIGSMVDIINIVSDYDNGINSIGYSYYYYATTMYDDIDEEVADRIKLLAIDGIQPTYETIKDGSYPIQTQYYIVINKTEPKNGNVRKLVNAMLSSRGQSVAKEAGYVSVK